MTSSLALLIYIAASNTAYRLNVPNTERVIYLLQEIVVNVSPNRVSFEVKVDVHVLPESTRVVISVGFGIAESFKDVVRLNQNVFYSK